MVDESRLVCDHPDVAKCLFFTPTRFHPENEVPISASWDVGEGISFCDEEVGAGGLVGDFGVRRGVYKQLENMSPPNSQVTKLPPIISEFRLAKSGSPF
jgi:hypothetical protein